MHGCPLAQLGGLSNKVYGGGSTSKVRSHSVVSDAFFLLTSYTDGYAISHVIGEDALEFK